jgi:hypothetical protein
MNLQVISHYVSVDRIGEDGMRTQLLRIVPPEPIESVERMVVARFNDEDFGYFPVVRSEEGGAGSWVWDCYQSILHYLKADGAIVGVAVSRDDDKVLALNAMRARAGRALCKFHTYHVDDYITHRIIAVDVRSPKPSVVELARGWHDGPDVRSFNFDAAFGDPPQLL